MKEVEEKATQLQADGFPIFSGQEKPGMATMNPIAIGLKQLIAIITG